MDQTGFFRFFDAPWFERSLIDLFSKETQNPFSDIRIQSWILNTPVVLILALQSRRGVPSPFKVAQNSFWRALSKT